MISAYDCMFFCQVRFLSSPKNYNGLVPVEYANRAKKKNDYEELIKTVSQTRGHFKK